MAIKPTLRTGLRLAAAFLLLGSLLSPLPAQRNLAGAVRTRLALEKLNVLGSVLMIGAHPDDENTALLAYLARGRKVRTGYLCLTRGEGGQNLIGPEQGDLLGLIRTQELLGARRIDGAEQFFCRAIDFGFSKTAAETLAKWDREAVLADIVWTIRRFRPDVIILQASGTSADGHGHHQAAGILGREAHAAAGDKSRFPDQLRWVTPWQARRATGRGGGAGPASALAIDTGDFDPLLGFSYAEIAGMSRSMHKSQGMGTPEQRGVSRNMLTQVAGEPAKSDIFDGIDTTWNRLPGGAEAGKILKEAVQSFQPHQPEKTIPLLVKARARIAAIKDPWATIKIQELDEAIASCAGLWLDASADRHAIVPGSTLQVNTEAINRSPAPMELIGVSLEGMVQAVLDGAAPAPLAYNQPARRSFSVSVPADQPYSQPFWLQKARRGEMYVVENQEMIGLAEPPPILRARFHIRVDGAEVDLVRPVNRRYVDRVDGESSRPLVVVPPVAVSIPETAILFPDAQPKKIEVQIRSHIAGGSGDVRLAVPDGWRVQPSSAAFRIAEADEQTSLSFTVSPPADSTLGELRAIATINGREISSGIQVTAYPGMPPQTTFPPSTARIARADVRILARKIGYVMGAGDEVARALRQLGCEVTMLDADELAGGDLKAFDAIVTGVRAYNVRADLRANQRRLLDYVQQGGTLVVQYNVADRRSPALLQGIGPYPVSLGNSRVSVEEAPVALLNPGHPLLTTPNRLGEEDFRGWIQERGLYFASKWDPQYEVLFESHDPGEPPQEGGTLYMRYGKGAYIFTAYSWFRQLPAGVPGAFRIFANFLSAAQSQ